MQVGSKLFGQIADAGPDHAVCDSETCRWQIAKATGVSSVHPVEVLYRASGLSARWSRVRNCGWVGRRV